MAAVEERVERGAGALDSDSISPRLSTPPPDQPHQNNPLLGLPIVAIETVLNVLSYDEISVLRLVRQNKNKTMNLPMRERERDSSVVFR